MPSSRRCHLTSQSSLIWPLIRSSLFWSDLSSSQSHIATDGQSVSLGAEPSVGLMTRYLLLFDSYGFVFCGALSLTRGRVCLLYVLLVLASPVFLGSESLTRGHILLSQFWDFPFHRLRLAGSRWRYSTPDLIWSDLSCVPFGLLSSTVWRTRRHLLEGYSLQRELH
jgi:hypothetical protein